MQLLNVFYKQNSTKILCVKYPNWKKKYQFDR